VICNGQVLAAGDLVELGIDGLGEQRSPVRQRENERTAADHQPPFPVFQSL